MRAETERMQKRGGAPMLDAAAAVASQFVAHVGAGRFAEAHALLAAPFKSAVSVDAFARRLPRVAAAGRRALRDAHAPAPAERRAAHRRSRRAACSIPRAGAVPIAFVFLQEPAGLRILVVSLGGVPVLQGVAPRVPERARPESSPSPST